MPAHLEIRGTAEFRRTAAKLKAAGDGKLVREMGRRMKVAARPAEEDAQRSVRSLSSAGVRGGGGQQRRAHTLSRRKKVTESLKRRAAAGRGLRASIARAVGTTVKAGGARASVEIKVRQNQLPRSQRRLPVHMNTGKWRHPVMGHRKVWVGQTVSPPGWWTRPMSQHGPKIRDDAIEAVDDIAKHIAR